MSHELQILLVAVSSWLFIGVLVAWAGLILHGILENIKKGGKL